MKQRVAQTLFWLFVAGVCVGLYMIEFTPNSGIWPYGDRESVHLLPWIIVFVAWFALALGVVALVVLFVRWCIKTGWPDA